MSFPCCRAGARQVLVFPDGIWVAWDGVVARAPGPSALLDLALASRCRSASWPLALAPDRRAAVRLSASPASSAAGVRCPGAVPSLSMPASPRWEQRPAGPARSSDGERAAPGRALRSRYSGPRFTDPVLGGWSSRWPRSRRSGFENSASPPGIFCHRPTASRSPAARPHRRARRLTTIPQQSDCGSRSVTGLIRADRDRYGRVPGWAS